MNLKRIEEERLRRAAVNATELNLSQKEENHL